MYKVEVRLLFHRVRRNGPNASGGAKWRWQAGIPPHFPLGPGAGVRALGGRAGKKAIHHFNNGAWIGATTTTIVLCSGTVLCTHTRGSWDHCPAYCITYYAAPLSIHIHPKQCVFLLQCTIPEEVGPVVHDAVVVVVELGHGGVVPLLHEVPHLACGERERERE